MRRPAPDLRKRFTVQCAMDNRLPSLVLAWLALAMGIIMLTMFVAQPYISKNTPFHTQYGFLYVLMLIISLSYLFLFLRLKNKLSSLMNLELMLLVFSGLWSAAFSAIDIINGYSSYLFIQIIVIEALLFRGYPIQRCLSNVAGFILYSAILFSWHFEFNFLFAMIINPFFMTVISCGIILMNDVIFYKSFINRERIREQNEELQFIANNDYLTEIPNRRNIMEHLDHMLAEDDGFVTCMMLDVDNFKIYNDLYGHIMGDDCLKRLAAVMQNVVARYGGRLGRYGGEEFLAVFCGLDLKRSVAIAEELVRNVKNQNICFNFREDIDNGFVTLSAGVAIGKAGTMDPGILIQNADSAMYYAKSQGKNRACCYNQEQLNRDAIV